MKFLNENNVRCKFESLAALAANMYAPNILLYI